MSIGLDPPYRASLVGPASRQPCPLKSQLPALKNLVSFFFAPAIIASAVHSPCTTALAGEQPRRPNLGWRHKDLGLLLWSARVLRAPKGGLRAGQAMTIMAKPLSSITASTTVLVARLLLLCKMAGIDFHDRDGRGDDASEPRRALAAVAVVPGAWRVPHPHDGNQVWDTIAIAGYLHDLKPRPSSGAGRQSTHARCAARSWRNAFGLLALRWLCL